MRSQTATLVNPRLVIVANRGPNDFVWVDGEWRTRASSGGLVSMLAPLASRPDVAWCCSVSEPPDAAQARHGLYTTTAADQAEPGLHVLPIPLPAPMFHAYYGEISNEVLWMRQHRLRVPPEVPPVLEVPILSELSAPKLRVRFGCAVSALLVGVGVDIFVPVISFSSYSTSRNTRRPHRAACHKLRLSWQCLHTRRQR